MTSYTETEYSVERRSKPRMECAFPAVVRQSGSGTTRFQEQATLLNLSGNGLYLRMNRRVEVGQALFVVARFSNVAESDLRTTRIAFRGTVVRSEARSDGMCGIAIMFNQHRFL